MYSTISMIFKVIFINLIFNNGYIILYMELHRKNILLNTHNYYYRFI